MRRTKRKSHRSENSATMPLYPFLASFAIAAVFTERLVVHMVAYGRAESIANALLHTSVIVCQLVLWFVFALALIIDRRAVQQSLTGLREFQQRVRKELWSPFGFVILAAALLLLAIRTGISEGQLITATLRAWIIALYDLGSELLSARVLIAIGAGTATYMIWWLIARYLRKHKKPVEEALYEALVSGTLVGTGAISYLVLFRIVVLPAVPAAIAPEAFGGLTKDTLIYSLVAFLVLAGTFKAEDTLRSITAPIARWQLFAVAGIITLVAALAAVQADLRFKDEILNTGRSLEYPTIDQQRLISAHIMLRDFLLLTPLIIVAFLRLARQIERINTEKRRGG